MRVSLAILECVKSTVFKVHYLKILSDYWNLSVSLIYLRTARMMCLFSSSVQKGEPLVSKSKFMTIFRFNGCITVCLLSLYKVYLYPRHLCRGVYSFRLSVRPFVCSFVRNSVPFVELLQSFTLRQVKRGISHQPLIRKQSFLDHRYPGGSAFIP